MNALRLETAAGRPPLLMCLGAHSDDIEIGCGGTLLALLERHPDARVVWVVFAASGPRAAEARAGARKILARCRDKEVRLHTFRDGFFPSAQAEIKEVFEALKPLGNPDLIFTHHRTDLHQDHRVISELARNTWRNHTILEYEIPKFDADLSPCNCYVPLSRKVAERKVAALMSAFPSQREKHWFDPETFLGLMRLRGLECNAPERHAEAFHAYKFTLG
jgi:LmbE family N-acetylglucosaminyl deacetylase